MRITIGFTLIFSVVYWLGPTPFAYGSSEQTFNCGNIEEARLLVQLIKTDPEQQRQELRCNALLTELAQQKAKVMAARGLVMHNLNGSPNSHLRNGGYLLPSYYGNMMSNQVEAIAGGYSSPEQVWLAFKQSDAHRQHLLGELPFYLEQDEIGVGFIHDDDTPHVQYWVVYISKGHNPNQQSKFTKDQIPNKSIFDPVLKPENNEEPF